jgi:hypothetical protein
MAVGSLLVRAAESQEIHGELPPYSKLNTLYEEKTLLAF